MDLKQHIVALNVWKNFWLMKSSNKELGLKFWIVTFDIVHCIANLNPFAQVKGVYKTCMYKVWMKC